MRKNPLRKSTVMFSLIVVAMLAIFLLGNGIAGMVVLDDYTRPICVLDTECAGDLVCCWFYGEESGVCHEFDMCSSITELTKETKLQFPQPTDVKGLYFLQILLGLIIAALAFYALLHYFRSV